MLSRKKNKSQVTKLVTDDKDISAPYEVCNALNSYFTEIDPTLASTINPRRVSFRDFIKPSHRNFEVKLITANEITKLVANLSTNKADGLDGISARHVKASFPFTAASLTHVFNSVISTGIIPSDWKSARITPIFKADSKVDPAIIGPYQFFQALLISLKKRFQSGVQILGRK